MAISNTVITIKKSTANGRPSSLAGGELAYSYVSNTLFIGTADASSTLNVGGRYYTTQIDNATSSNIVSTIVKRDTNGAFAGRLFGNANTATALETARNFSIGGAGEITASDVSFDGTGNVILSANLNNTGAVAGQYGSGTLIPQITVDARGRVTSITTVSNPGGGGAGAVSLNFANTSIGSPYVSVSGGNTLNLFGLSGGGISTSTVNSNGISFAVDSTVARTTSGQSFTGNQIFTNDVSISGNLIVLGNSTIIRSSSLDIGDSLIYLANNNLTSDIVDIGIIGHYNDGVNAHSGIFRDPVLKEWIFFKGYTPEVQSNNLINIADPSFAYANVYAAYHKGNVIGTTASISGGLTTGSLNIIGSSANQIFYQTPSGITGFITAPTQNNTFLNYTTGGGFSWQLANSASVGKANVSTYQTVTTAIVGTWYPGLYNGTSGDIQTYANNTFSFNVATSTLSSSYFSGNATYLTNLTANNLTGNIPSTVISNSKLVDWKNATAQYSLSGGGDVTVSINSDILWNDSVLAGPVQSVEYGSVGYITINCPTSGVVTYYDATGNTTTLTCTASGIPLNPLESVYYEVTEGQSSTYDQTKFRVVNYNNQNWTPGPGWLLICTSDSYFGTTFGNIKWLPGQINIPEGGTYYSSTGQTSWLTSTYATLAGDVSGGSANQILYQTGAGATSYITAPTQNNTFLNYQTNSGFSWQLANGASVGTANVSTYQTVTNATTGTYYAALYNGTSGDRQVYANNALSFNAATGALTLGNGSVGIGVSNPTQKLDIVGNQQILGKIISGNSINSANITNVLNLSSSSGINAFRPFNLIDSAGTIKVARTTDDPTNSAALEFQTWTANVVTNTSYWDVYGDPNGFGIRDRFLSPAKNRIYISANGNVLIGSNSSTSVNSLTEVSNNGITNIFQVQGNSYFVGNVGIGTTSPTYKLDVSGTANTGALTVSSLNITGAAANQIFYEAPSGITGFIAAPTQNNTFLNYQTNTGFSWQLANGASVGSANVSTYQTVTNATTGTWYPALYNGTSGDRQVNANNALSFNSATGALAATSFNASGTAISQFTDSSGVATSNKTIQLNNGTNWLAFQANASGGSYNSITTVGDAALWFSNGSGTSSSTPGNLVIAPWSGIPFGLRLNSAANTVAVTGSITSTANITASSGTVTASSFSGAGTGLTGTAASLTAGNATLAADVSGGSANQILYQTGASATGYITAPSSGSTFLSWNGSAFIWTTASAGSIAGANVANYEVVTNVTSGLYYPALYSATSGNLAVGATSSLSYNVSSGVISANAFSGGTTATTSIYSLPNTNATAQWIFLGTWNNARQDGSKAVLEIATSAGYNAGVAQNSLYKIFFKTSNGSSFQNGSSGNFYADGMVWKSGPASTITSLRVVQVSNNSFGLYANCTAYTGDNSVYSVSVAQGNWTNSASLSTPSGNFVDLPIYTYIDSNNYNSYAPTLTGTGASGTWGISITGNAGTATDVAGGSANAIVYQYASGDTRFITGPSTNNTFLNYTTGGGFTWQPVITSAGGTFTGSVTINGDLNVSGNTTFTGNTSYINVTHLEVNDPVIYLGANNYSSDLVSIGFVGNYFNGANNLHTGLFRQHASNNYHLFTGVRDELDNVNVISTSANGFMYATLYANINSPSIVATTLSGSTITGSTITLDSLYLLDANSFTTSSTAQVSVDSFATATYRSAKYQAQITSGSSYHVIELLLVHDGTTVYLSQYGEIFTGVSLGTFDATITSGTLNLLFTPTNATTTIKVAKNLITV